MVVNNLCPSSVSSFRKKLLRVILSVMSIIYMNKLDEIGITLANVMIPPQSRTRLRPAVNTRFKSPFQNLFLYLLSIILIKIRKTSLTFLTGRTSKYLYLVLLIVWRRLYLCVLYSMYITSSYVHVLYMNWVGVWDISVCTYTHQCSTWLSPFTKKIYIYRVVI